MDGYSERVGCADDVHDWHLTGQTMSTDGTHVEFVCAQCGVLTVEGPDWLAGRI